MVWVINATPQTALPPGKTPGAGLDGCGKSRPHWESIPGQCSP
jgi:hypothetical protein